MKRLLAVLLIAVSAAANAQILSAVIASIQTITADRVPVHYIKVESTAPDFELARKNAFKVAVEHAVGTIVVSEAEMRNNKLTRDEIINYSSGFVDRYNILNQKNVSGGVQIVVEVWVSHSAIANRLLNNSKTAGEVQGDRIAVQLESIGEQRTNSDRLLGAVMRDYPNRAFDVKLQPVNVEIDQSRKATLLVPFTIGWNKKYLSSLEEVIKNINQYPVCSVNIPACNNAQSSIVLKTSIVSTNPGAWFNDNQPWTIMFGNMVLSEPTYRLKLQTSSGRDLVYCFAASELDQREYRTRYLASLSGGKTVINGLDTMGVTLRVGLNNIDPGSVVGATLDVVRRAQCN